MAGDGGWRIKSQWLQISVFSHLIPKGFQPFVVVRGIDSRFSVFVRYIRIIATVHTPQGIKREGQKPKSTGNYDRKKGSPAKSSFIP